MIYLSQTGAGTKDSFTEAGREIRDPAGSGLLAIQAEVTGAAQYRLLGRSAPEAPWREILAAQSDGFINKFTVLHSIQLEVLSGAGTVELWICDRRDAR